MPSTSSTRQARTAAALDQLGRLHLREHTMQSLLQTVAQLARSVLPGDPEASVYSEDGRHRFTVAATGRLATDLDEVQYSEHEGPCLHAARTGRPVEVRDTRTEQRWPEYCRRAAALGNLSSLSVPLAIDEGVTGALNIYARAADVFDDEARAAATRFGSYAAVAVSNMQDYDEARSTARHLGVALTSRAVIDQAKGILMERERCTADQAFQALVEVSARSNTKLRLVAEQLVLSGELAYPRISGSAS